MRHPHANAQRCAACRYACQVQHLPHKHCHKRRLNAMLLLTEGSEEPRKWRPYMESIIKEVAELEAAGLTSSPPPPPRPPHPHPP